MNKEKKIASILNAIELYVEAGRICSHRVHLQQVGKFQRHVHTR